MVLIRLENVSLAFGEAPLLDKVELEIHSRERIFLIGRNGMGKSCLLKVIRGDLAIDDGKIYRSPQLKIAELGQNLGDYGSKTVYEVVAEGLQEIGQLLTQYHQLTSVDDFSADPNWLNKLEAVQKQLEAKQGWQYPQMLDAVLTELELPADKPVASLSGGWQRRVALAKALVSKPDVLLLDEPTNHLDLEAIIWLENYLTTYTGTVVCITHDRAMLRKLSQRIVELDRGKIYSFEGNYDDYLQAKQHRLEVEERQAKLFDKVLAREEAWIRQGIKARRTRNEGRVRALKKLREERRQRRELQGKPKFGVNEALLSGDLVVEAEHVNYAYGDKVIVKDFSTKIYRGDKIAFIGPNGVGKTTVLKLLLGELAPQQGKIKLGTKLEIAYFDQLRSGINPKLSAVENVASGREMITVQGKQKHVMSYLADFLFTPDRARTPVEVLSGGETNRLLLAKLFSLPANLLVLDEPTNDLDIESLELLEDILVEYQGTLLLVSHDRSFVDEVATSTFYFMGDGKINEYEGGYSDIPNEIKMMVAQEKNTQKIILGAQEKGDQEESVPETLPGSTNQVSSARNLKPLSSKLKRELADLPSKIAKLEETQQQLQHEIAEPSFYQKEKTYMEGQLQKLAKIDQELAALYRRWEELEILKDS